MKKCCFFLTLLAALCLSACGAETQTTEAINTKEISDIEPVITVTSTAAVSSSTAETKESSSAAEPEKTTEAITTEAETTEAETTEAETTEAESTSAPKTEPESTAAPTEPQTKHEPSGEKNGLVICIDPGHQAKANMDQEPLGPGSSTMKTKVASGTQGTVSKVPEYVVNLQVALKLKALLLERGYEVIMTRESAEVNISNVERAEIANNAGVDAFVRVHCNGSETPEVNGILACCQTPGNQWIGADHDEYARLCRNIVDAMCALTGAKNMGIQETDSMTGINWCRVPTALVEMGFMTNPSEDVRLTDDAYQNLLAEGIANGLDVFFGR